MNVAEDSVDPIGGNTDDLQSMDNAIVALAEEAERDSSPEETTSVEAPSSSWVWLLVGLLAGLFALVVTQVVLSEFQAPLPEEYSELNTGDPYAPRSPEAKAMEVANWSMNHGRLLYSLGATMAIIFGWATGVLNQRIIRGLLGALAGILVALGLGMLLSPAVSDLQSTVITSRQNTDLYGMSLHAFQWAIIGLPIAAAIGIGTGRPMSSLKVVGAVALAALFGGIVYVIGGSLLDPGARLSYARPADGKLFYLWHLVPPLLCGLFLSRSKL